uniref:Uncharacterized protein n=1 Tax=Glossina pallidipes TaxID=7398 RepID=A0A1B0ACJ0_GLOPL
MSMFPLARSKQADKKQKNFKYPQRTMKRRKRTTPTPKLRLNESLNNKIKSRVKDFQTAMKVMENELATKNQFLEITQNRFIISGLSAQIIFNKNWSVVSLTSNDRAVASHDRS